ncbi:type II secretion system F family protein [Caldalkalibacillus salinus]|uniref:type II secretion system F family protein n=1 Tax=Caldalkalibacillus salinus TaxID=2803787 RepID=UPI0019226F59|nr:type II secretion system F family protein [Caldalkalibacillus salinus]
MLTLLALSLVAGGLTYGYLIIRDKRASYVSDSWQKDEDQNGARKRVHLAHENKNLNQSKQPIHYETYTMSTFEKVAWASLAMSALFVLGYIFYQRIPFACLISLAGLYYPKLKRKQIITKRQRILNMQFKNALHALSSNLSAGRSIENACLEVISDLKLLYPDLETFMTKEFERMTRKMQNGESLEEVFLDFSKRSGVEDIKTFTQILVACKRKGGDLVDVIRRTSQIMGEKLEIQQEIHVLLAQKKFESQCLSIIPFTMVAILAYSSPDYVAPLYETAVGTVVMTISLLALGMTYWWSTKIMNIEV